LQILKKSPSIGNSGPGKLSRELEPSFREPATTYSKNDSVKTIHLGCFPQLATPITTDAAMLKIGASLCFGKNKVKVRGKNKITEEEILIFQSGRESKFTTNYIALQLGKNEVTLDFFDGKKSFSTTLEITRNSQNN
jgi:hypothetical protein